ncbi:MAG: hypothetical protein LDL31_04280, partial [Prosthecobacter sp.]|nr:hypothetical protein [Prosthecobacter sp.]
QVGDGTFTNRNSPVQVAGTWSQVAAGGGYTVGIRTDGTLWAWGLNTSGQLGDGTTTNRTSPVQIGTDTNWAAVSCGQDFTLALKTNGTLWAWGGNFYSQVGNGTSVNQTSPVQIGTATNWKSICAGGFHSVAVRLDGTLWAWGDGSWGALGLGDTTNEQIEKLSASLSWGALGLGDTTNRNTPVRVGTGSSWVEVQAGNGHTVARQADGSLWTCGLNTNAQLGLGDQTQRLTLERTGQGGVWATVNCGFSSTYVLAADGTLHVWGEGSGYSGLSARSLTRSLPPRAGGWAQISMSTAHLMLRTPDGRLWAQGQGTNGRLGLGDTVSRPTAVPMGTHDDWFRVSAGSTHTLAIREDGSLWAWGLNTSGQIGDGTSTTRQTPVRIGTANDWASIAASSNAHSLATKHDGTLWAWGLNSNSQIGDGTTTSRTSPVQVAGTGWVAVAAGSFHSLGLKSDGTLWAWGFNGNGQLGDGTTTSRSTPTQIGTATDWVAIRAGGSSSAALRQDGSLWTWGLNSEGQLGSGTTSSRSSPGRVGLAVDWVDVACGSNAMAGLRADGTLWVWGAGAAGQLGEGNAANALSPRQLGNGTTWVAVQAGETCLAAVQADGSVWTAGMTGGFRLGAAAGRSAFATAPVLPGLFPQTLEQTAEGSGVRVTASSGLPVSLSLLSGQATLAGGVITPMGGPGSTVRVLAWQPGDDTAWDAAQPVEVALTLPSGQLTVLDGEVELSNGGDEIDFGMANPSVPVLRTFTLKNTGSGPLNLTRLSTSSTIGWQVITQGMQTVLEPEEETSFTVAFQSVLGGLSLTTIRIESDDPEAPFTFRAHGISRFAQSITFASTPEQECGTPLNVSGLATASSGLPVLLEVSEGDDVATLSGHMLIFLKAGTVTLRATQPGGGLYGPAAPTSHAIQVRRGPQVLTFATGLPTSISHRGTVSLAATSSRGLTPITFRVVSGPGQLSGSNLSFSGPGEVLIEAAQAGDAAFLPTTAERSFLSTNAAPVALAQSLSTPDSVPLPLTLTGQDADEDPLVFMVVTPPAHGTLSGTSPALAYVSEPGYAGPDSFTFKAWDGFAESAPVTVEITVTPVAPALAGSAPPVVVNPGGRAMLQVPHTGSRPLSYQWWKGSLLLEGKTDSTLVIDPAAEADEGSYSVVISNSAGNVTGGPAVLQVNDPVQFTQQPLSQAIGEFHDVELSVQTTGTAPITYQWFRGTTPIPGATGRTLTISSIMVNQAGSYHVVATNPVGSVPSAVAVLDVVGITPRITQQPTHQMVHAGGVISLEVAALGRRPLAYQWLFNGRKLPGATGPRLDWYNAGAAQAGKYSVLVSTSAGARISEVAEVGVVVNQPARLTLAENGSTTLRVTTAGNGLTYTWTRQGAAMPPLSRAKPSADGKSLVFTKAQSEDSGTYFCQVTGPGGTLPGGTLTLSIFDTAPDLLDDQQMPPAMVGGFFTHQIRLNGGGESTPSSYTVQNLPPGLTVNALGLISGRPTVAGTRNLKIKATNRHGSDEVTATLIVKPFPARLSGVWTGVVTRNTPLNLGLGGRLDLTVAALGAVSGRLTLGSLPAYALTGAVTLDATEVVPPKLLLTLPRTGSPTPAPLQLEIIFDTSMGTTSEGSLVRALTESASIEAWRNPWKTGTNPCAFPGFHTFAMRRTVEEFTDAAVPHGHGYGSFTVAAAGTTTISGRTADGEPFTSASPMGGQGQLAIFSLQYPAPGRGSLRGILQVSAGARADISTDNLVDGSLDWSRPDKRPKGGVVYPAGFGPISLTATGGAYLAPPRHLGLGSGLNIAKLTFAGGGVAFSQVNPDSGIHLDFLNRLSPGTPNLGNLTLRSTASLATFSGDFTLNDPHWQKPPPARWTRKVPFQGMVIHRAGLYWGAGYYLLPALPTADPVKFPPLQFSGRVLWERNGP